MRVTTPNSDASHGLSLHLDRRFRQFNPTVNFSLLHAEALPDEAFDVVEDHLSPQSCRSDSLIELEEINLKKRTERFFRRSSTQAVTRGLWAESLQHQLATSAKMLHFSCPSLIAAEQHDCKWTKYRYAHLFLAHIGTLYKTHLTLPQAWVANHENMRIASRGYLAGSRCPPKQAEN